MSTLLFPFNFKIILINNIIYQTLKTAQNEQKIYKNSKTRITLNKNTIKKKYIYIYINWSIFDKEKDKNRNREREDRQTDTYYGERRWLDKMSSKSSSTMLLR